MLNSVDILLLVLWPIFNFYFILSARRGCHKIILFLIFKFCRLAWFEKCSKNVSQFGSQCVLKVEIVKNLSLVLYPCTFTMHRPRAHRKPAKKGEGYTFGSINRIASVIVLKETISGYVTRFGVSNSVMPDTVVNWRLQFSLHHERKCVCLLRFSWDSLILISILICKHSVLDQ